MRSYVWPLIIFCSAIVASMIANGSSSQSSLRVLFSFWFLLVCPGMAFVRIINLKERLEQWVLAVGLSIAIDVIVSEIAVLNRLWSLQGMVTVLADLSMVGALIQVLQSIIRRRKQASNEFDHDRALE